jgi:hypothetical protein
MSSGERHRQTHMRIILTDFISLDGLAPAG